MNTDWTEHWNRSNRNSITWNIWKWNIRKTYKDFLSGMNIKGSAIELGCGSGLNSLILSQVSNLDKITLVDSNEKAIEIAKNTFKGSGIKTEILKKDVLKIRPKEKFDIVHSEGLAEHFYGKDRQKIFKKHADLCKEDGKIIIFVPYDSMQYKVFRKAYSMFGKWIWDEVPFTREELFSICKRNKLKILKISSNPLMHEVGVLLQK